MRGIPPELDDLTTRWAQRLPGRVLLWADCGTRAAGLAGDRSPWRLRGVHAADPERLLGLDPPERTLTFSGHAAGANVDLVSWEIGLYLERLRDGDPEVVGLPYSPLPVVADDLHGQLLEQVRFSLDQPLGERWLREAEANWSTARADEDRRLALATLLTGALLLRTGELVWSAPECAAALGLSQDLVDLDGVGASALSLLRTAAPTSTLPSRAEHAALSEFLLFVRDLDR